MDREALIKNGINDAVVPNRIPVNPRAVAVPALLGVGFLGGAAGGLAKWFTAGIFFQGTDENAFDASEVVGFTAFLILAVWGFALPIAAVRYATLAFLPAHAARIAYLVFGILFSLAFLVLAAVKWGAMLKCGVFFCLNPASHPAPADATLGDSVRFTVGVCMVAVTAGMVVAFIGSFLFPVVQGAERLVKRSVPRALRTVVSALLLLGVFVGYFIIGCYSADSFAQSFTPWAQAAAAATNWQSAMPPEYSDAFFTTKVDATNSQYVFLQVYPGNVAIYAYLFGMISFGLLINSVGPTRRWTSRQLHIRLPFLSASPSIFHILCTLLTVLMFVIFTMYWWHDHRFNSAGGPPGSAQGITRTEQAARAFGQIAVAFLSLLLFPVTRTSIVHRIIGTTPEAFTTAHRVLGYGVLICAVVHIALWWTFYRIQNHPITVLKIPTMLPLGPASSSGAWEIGNFTIPVQSIVTYFVLLPCMGILAATPIRRKFWELFKYTHLFAAYAFIPATLYHANAGWEYLLPGLTVYLIDRFIRLSRSGRPVTNVVARAVGDITMIEFEGGIVSHHAGQYLYINIPALALFEWHPFTISSDPMESTHTLHIKAQGPGTFTGRLRDLVEKGPATFDLFVDGPVGRGDAFIGNDYDTVLLVAGGIGITPCASLSHGLRQAQVPSIRLIWATRESSDLLAALRMNTDVLAGALIYDTRATASSGNVRHGRPDFPTIFGDLNIAGGLRGRVLLFACGPTALCASARDAILALRSDARVHIESFEL